MSVRNRSSFSISRFVAPFIAVVFAFFALAGAAFAAVEVNSADVSQLETVKGIGPSLSGKILAARKQGNFKDWSDLEARVSGIGERNAAGFSRAGLTVGGKAKEGAVAGTDTTARAAKGSTKKSVGGGDTTVASNARK